MKKVDLEVKSPTARLFNDMIENHPEVSQYEIANAIGLGSSGNTITHIKKGRTKLPVRYIGALCKMLGEDPTQLVQTALSEYYPDLIELMSELKGEAYDKEEAELLRIFRRERAKAQEELEEQAKLAAIKYYTDAGEVPNERAIRMSKQVKGRLTTDKHKLNRLSKLIPSLIEAD